MEHLEELRRRMFWCLSSFGAALIAAYSVHAQLVRLLAAPLPTGAPEPVTLSVAEPFMTSFRVSVYAALAVTIPIVAWHVWAFLAPVVDKGRRRGVATFTLAGLVLLVGGMAFGYLVALPQSLAFLTSYDSGLYDIQLRAGELYRFNALVLLACGVVFQLPIVLLGLVRFRVLSVAKLRRNRRVGWAAVAVLAVCMPGVDPVLTAITFAPLLVLYESTVFIAARLERRWRRTDNAATKPAESGHTRAVVGSRHAA